MGREPLPSACPRDRPDAADARTARGRVRFAGRRWRLVAAVTALAFAGLALMDWLSEGPAAASRDPLGTHPHWVQAVAFAPDSRRLASAGYDGSLYLWDARRAALERIL